VSSADGAVSIATSASERGAERGRRSTVVSSADGVSGTRRPHSRLASVEQAFG
jgi:hypothetical protein